MPAVETIRQGWLKRGRFQPIAPYPRLTEDGLILGSSTLLARKNASADLMIAGDERRVLALLSAAYGVPVQSEVIGVLRRAAKAWAKGDKSNPNHDELGRFASGVGSATAVEHARELQIKKSPWLHHPNPAMREKLAEMESSTGKPNGGYDQKSATTTALGRYQILDGALLDAGWKDTHGSWTAKAQAAGVNSDDDFLKNPEAQEQALTDVTQRNTEQLRAKANGSYARIGSTVIDSSGNKITVTEAGLIAAAHKQGARAVKDYFTWVNGLNGNTQGTNPVGAPKIIGGRLRNAADTPYNRVATTAHTRLPGRKIAP